MVSNTLQKIVKNPKFIVETNTDIPISSEKDVLRANVYRPLDTETGARFPALLTLGPYGKDVPYSNFNPKLYADLPDGQNGEFSAWETPNPAYWTQHGYVIVRIDERGTGQSPGVLDPWSTQYVTDFADSIEWAAAQPWCTGKIGLLGVSYYAMTQWFVAARRPKGLTCIIPWEGASDVYRDCARQGGIFANVFLEWWQEKLLTSNQYGLPGKAARNWGPDTIEAGLSDAELRSNRVNVVDVSLKSKYLDDEYFASRVFDFADIDVPLLSVANWGGITLHLNGNVRGYMETSSKNKWLYFITGRHDLPFYLPEFVALQKSFFDAWLKGQDDRGWLKGPNAPGGVPAISVVLRSGNPGYNTTEAERTFARRTETEWPISRTQYVRYYLNVDTTLTLDEPAAPGKFSYRGLDGEILQFKTAPFQEETEFTGHVVANLMLSIQAGEGGEVPTDLDLFVTLRHFDANGNEIYYTGTTGDPVPVCKGSLRASLRKIDSSHPMHRDYRPYRPYTRDAVEYPQLDEQFEALVELWPTNVVVAAGNRLVFEVSPHVTQGYGVFGCNHPQDRSSAIFAGTNVLFVGPPHQSWVQLPYIPRKSK